MELKDFVTTTLNEIIDGVVEAQKHAKEKGGVVAPPDLNLRRTAYEPSIQKIEFDVAITVTNEDKTKGGIGVLAGIVNGGVQGEDNQTNNEFSRVKFSVPITFPLQEK